MSTPTDRDEPVAWRWREDADCAYHVTASKEAAAEAGSYGFSVEPLYPEHTERLAAQVLPEGHVRYMGRVLRVEPIFGDASVPPQIRGAYRLVPVAAGTAPNPYAVNGERPKRSQARALFDKWETEHAGTAPQPDQ